jgi:CHAD domain-containing protein
MADLERGAGMRCERDSARAAIRAAIAGSVDRLNAALPSARLGEDPEGVHQARVATRRLRSDLRTFAPMLDDTWRIETRAELKVLADRLGAVRDADVLMVRLGDACDQAGIDLAAGARILAVLAEQGRSHRDALLVALDDVRTDVLLARLAVAATDPPTVGRAIGRAERRLRPLVRAPWRKLSRAVDALGDEPPIAALHRVRLLAKRSRYATEAVVPVYGKDARRFANAVTGIQDVLGEMNDAEVAATWLARIVHDLDPDAAFAGGQLTVRLHTDAESHRHGWERAYQTARKRSHWLD